MTNLQIEPQLSSNPGVPALTPGTVLQETYRIVRLLDEGGCGQVYVADHMRLPGQCAVKILHRSMARDEAALARFRQEAAFTAALRHPHIVQVFDFNVTEEGVPYLVMELLEGRLLSARVPEREPLDPRSTVHIVEQIAEALAVAHKQGIVHRDLKPDNVMLLSSGSFQDFVKILDFGISQASSGPRLTADECVTGTPSYMSPEQASARRDEIRPGTDQFSLGAITYKLLTGREPFTGDDPIAILYAVVNATPPAPSQVASWLGTSVDDVVMRGLSKNADDRYPDIQAFAAALREAVDRPAEGSGRARAELAEASGPSSGPSLAPPSAPPVAAAAPDEEPTIRIRRRGRSKRRGRSFGLATLLVCGAVALVRFSPPTRAAARTTWGVAQMQARWLYGRARGVVSAATAPAPQESPRSWSPAATPMP